MIYVYNIYTSEIQNVIRGICSPAGVHIFYITLTDSGYMQQMSKAHNNLMLSAFDIHEEPPSYLSLLANCN